MVETMNIEQKAKAYDEALERAKKVHKYSSDLAEIKRMEEIFPELRKSEDEEIKEELTEFLKMASGGFLDTTIQCKKFGKWLAWLEKQGEQPQGKTALEAIKEEKVDNQNRLKPADKVEPKFKVGDWVVLTAGELSDTIQIADFDTNRKQYWFNDGSYLGIVDEECLHHWTIQDAKDGDVLSYRDGQWIFIYKKQVDDNSFHYYSLYSTIHQDLTIDDSAFTLLGDAIIPATKEQRDLLFQKMHEAGYEWDAEKKELKNIHVIDEGKAEMDYCFTKMMNGEKVSSAWSKEDEQIILSIEQVMNCASLLNIVPDKIDKIRTWLKNIKQRIGG